MEKGKTGIGIRIGDLEMKLGHRKTGVRSLK